MEQPSRSGHHNYKSSLSSDSKTSRTPRKMAIGNQPPQPPSWARWQGHEQPSPEYVMMDPSSMMRYDSRETSQAPAQRPSLTPQYTMSNSYSVAPMTSMPAPHYQQSNNPFEFNSYTPPSQMPLMLRQYIEQERSPQEHACPRDDRPVYLKEQARAPIKAEIQQASPTTSSSPEPKTITPNTARNEEGQKTFNTEVDVLVRQILAKRGRREAGNSPASRYPSPEHDKTDSSSRSSSPEEAQSGNRHKRYRCNVANCSKRFVQKTHLTIHLRAHTGEKPYMCSLAGCGLRFSQRGNLKTHERRHSGEKPFHCNICGKSFAQHGNVRAHKATHDPVKKFHCRLDSCTKDFTQLGNLKSHQNRFHVDTVRKLSEKAAHLDLDDIPEEERHIFEDFANLYKNSCKGIKGRGKNRKIEPPTQTPSKNIANVSSQYPVQQHTPPMQHVPYHAPHHQPQQGHHGLDHHGSYAHYAVPNTTGPSYHFNIRGGYEAYEVDQDSMSVSGATSSTPGTIYEEDHDVRGLAFGDRMY